MSITARSRKRWQLVTVVLVSVASIGLIILVEARDSPAAIGVGLAIFFLLLPLIFLGVAPPSKPGLDPFDPLYPGPTSPTERPPSSGHIND